VIPMSLGRLSGKAFLAARFFRLWPTYATAFTLSLIAFAALYSTLDTRWPFTVLNITVAYLLVLRDLIGSPNIDGIVWTLEVEVKFYLLCAVCAPLFRRRSLAVFLLPLGLAALHTLVVINAHRLGGTIFSEPARAVVLSVPYLIYMFVGTAFYYLHVGRLALYQAMLAIVALYLLQLAVVMSGPVAVRIGEYWNYGYALMLFAFAAAFQNLFPSTRMTDFVASISYPLYAVHNIVGYAIFRIMMAAGHSVAITLAVMTGVAIALAWILHVAIERPTRNLGRRIAAQIDSSREGS
jgi:peptidoglycan/LPS O-acetylase OafA/YrhL